MPGLFDEVPWWTTADMNNALSRERDKKLPVRPSFFNALVPQVKAQDAAVNRPDPVERASLFPLATYPDGSTKLALPGMIAEDIPRAFTAPARAYRGEIADEDMISEGLNFAGNMAIGGSAVPKPSNAAGMFGGRLTGSADNAGIARSLDTDIARQIHEAQRAANPAADPNRLAQIEKRGPYYEVSSPVGNVRAVDVPDGVRITSSKLDPDVPRGMGYGSPLYEALANESSAAGKPMLSDQSVSPFAQRVYEKLERKGYDVRGPGDDAIYHDNGFVVDPYQAPFKVRSNSVQQRDMPPSLQPPPKQYTDAEMTDRVKNLEALLASVRSGTDDILYGNGKSSGVPGVILSQAGDQAPRVANPIRAYHGSPHDFDKFDLSKIGTGEGAQAYGHGLYFAENEGVAKSYRDALSTRAGSEDAAYMLSKHNGDKAAALVEAEKRLAEAKGNWPAMEAAVRELRGDQQPGKMYEVNIHADPNDFLDWDKPIGAQERSVRDKLKSVHGPVRPSTPNDLMQTAPNDEISKRLREAGIPGIKYLDQGSRTAGEGSRNYVVFDQDLIDILRKYMNPPTAAAPGVLMYQGAKDSRE